MTLVKRLVKGSALTWAEADGNLDHFTDALALKADLEAELISGAETTVAGTTVTVASATWRIPPGVYATVAATEFTGIVNSSTDNQRYVAFYGTTVNTITKVEGTEAVIAVLPDQPANTALLSYVLVGDAGIEAITQALAGYQLKSEKTSDIETNKTSEALYPNVKGVYDWGVAKFAPIRISNSTTTYLSLSDLNTSYPSALVGQEIICESITDGPLIYKKGSAGWYSIPLGIVS